MVPKMRLTCTIAISPAGTKRGKEISGKNTTLARVGSLQSFLIPRRTTASDAFERVATNPPCRQVCPGMSPILSGAFLLQPVNSLGEAY